MCGKVSDSPWFCLLSVGYQTTILGLLYLDYVFAFRQSLVLISLVREATLFLRNNKQRVLLDLCIVQPSFTKWRPRWDYNLPIENLLSPYKEIFEIDGRRFDSMWATYYVCFRTTHIVRQSHFILSAAKQ